MSIVKLNNRAVKDITTFGSVSSGSLQFIKKITADNDSTISFVDGSSSVVFDSTYKEYLFTLKNIHPVANAVDLLFQFSTNSGSSYGVSMTTSCFQAYHQEDDNPANLNFRTGSVNSLANSTNFQSISTADGIGNDNDQCLDGFIRVYNPADTTFVKHFMANTTHYTNDNASMNTFVQGYVNTTSAIDAIQFKMNDGSSDTNLSTGDICLYGIN
tara:strand:+ start:367 stop:1008 length:642 start_codon:yes stop_codon:yes gene_type:complete